METPNRAGWRTSLLATLALLLLLSAPTRGAEPAYFNQPDLHADRVVFTAENDLWLVAVDGGAPQRLTTHPGNEAYPAFSPDGRWIAFTGQYDGNADVYLIPTEGGEPRRLTWHPGGDVVVGWIPGAKVLFRSGRHDPHGSPHLYTVGLEGGEPEELPLGWAVRLDVDPDSGLWAFNRKSRETSTWKRYRGGTASDLWVGDPEKADFRRITDFEGIDHFPMWHDGRIWFLSDQGGTYDIWSIAPDGSDRRRHTELGDWDARWPSMGDDGRIVFSLAADIHVFDPADDSVKKIEIELPSDRPLTRTRYPDASENVTGFDLSPDGERLAVVTRGEIVSVPVEQGVSLMVTRGTGARERDASFGPKGKHILYLTDEPGEDEIRTMDAWGRGEPQVVRAAQDAGWVMGPLGSPDGKYVAYASNDYGLYVVDTEGGSPRRVDRSTEFAIRQYAWSPDGRWLAYAKALPSEFRSIFLYDTVEKQTRAVTGPYTDDASPVFDPDGRYLYFVSNRATNPVLGDTDFIDVEVKNDKLYLVLLLEDVDDPMAPRAGLPPDDEEEADDSDDENGENGENEENGEKKDDDALTPVEIDLEGLSDRVVELPVDRGVYGALGATSTHLFFLSSPVRGMAEMPALFAEGAPVDALMSFDLKEKEAKSFAEGVSGYALAPGADKIAVMTRPGQVSVVGAASPPGAALAENMVDLSEVTVELDPRAEWRQIYREAWRQMREYYWDEDLGGVRWEDVRDRYAQLLPRLASRADLSDLLGQIFGEMATSHTYVFGGDSGVDVERRSVGLLGADVSWTDGAWRVDRIYRGDPADRVRSPLDEPGVDVEVGDYLLAVDRVPFAEGEPFVAAFEERAGKEILLTVNDRPSLEDSREVIVVPLRNDGDLRYSDWVRHNRELVSERTDGRIGYIHLPDMWTSGLVEFNTWFYPQLDKEGMIVDVRWNGGGAVSEIVLDRLRRPVLSFSLARGGEVGTYPTRVLNGPFVVLTNEFAGSDGDIFPQAVQLEDLAPVIGMRSWGGVVGIRSMRPLVDGGLITNPEVAWWDPRAGWSLENRGVIPDIEVQNLPQELARGEDSQLARGIEEVLRLHEQNPPLEPDFGDIPDRGRRAFRGEGK